jgi:hypothetical protein
MIVRMPVACGEDGQAMALEFSYAAIERLDDLVSQRHSQGPTGQKIILDVDQYESVAGVGSARADNGGA